MMDQQEETPAYSSRSEAFGTGAAPSPGLQLSQEQMNAGPKQFTADGVNQPLMLSPDGNSATDAQRMLFTPPGEPQQYLPAVNGISQSSSELRRPFNSTSLNY
jgi:hypothetical protein